MFYGMEPQELSKSSYARIKDSFPSSTPHLPRQVRSSAFRIDTGTKKDPKFQQNENAFFLQSEKGSKRSSVVDSRDNRLRDHKLSSAGSHVMNINQQEETESRKYKRAQKAFYLLPSSHASQHPVNNNAS
jgi:hypothetical protein